MEQYINKAAVVAEVNSLQETTMDKNQNFLSSYHEGIFDGLSLIKSFLDTIEGKGVIAGQEFISFDGAEVVEGKIGVPFEVLD